MKQMEELRQTVTMDEIEHAKEALKPKPKKKRVAKTKTETAPPAG